MGNYSSEQSDEINARLPCVRRSGFYEWKDNKVPDTIILEHSFLCGGIVEVVSLWHAFRAYSIVKKERPKIAYDTFGQPPVGVL